MYDFIKKWTSTPKLQESLEIAVNLYVDQFKKDYKELLIKILNDIEFYDLLSFKSIVDDYRTELLTNVNEKSKIISLIRDNNSHNSYVFLGFLHGDIEITQIDIIDESLIEEINNEINFIVVDDYAGSLCSFEKFLNKLHDEILKHPKFIQKGKINILFFPVFITCFALNKFDLIKDNYSLFDISVKYFEKIRPAKYVTSGQNLSKIQMQTFIEFSNYLCVKDKYIYGYNNIEDIIIFNHFVPNNTLGCLWWKNNFCFSLFGRYYGYEDYAKNSHIPIEQQKFFKSIIVKKGNSQYPLFNILLLCGFNRNDIERIMRISSARYEYLLRKSIEYEIVSYDDGKYIKSTNINNYIYYDKLESYISVGIMLKPEDEISARLIKAKTL